MKDKGLWIAGAGMAVFGWALLAVGNDLSSASPGGDPKGTVVHRDLEYVPGGHPQNKLDLYLPEKSDGPLPVILWVHGGAWLTGSKEHCPASALTARGYAVASMNYRLSQHARFPAQIEDCKAAVRWLRANAGRYHLDPDHIAAWGASSGGHLVALLGTSGGVPELEGTGGNLELSSRVQAVIVWFGPTDLLRMGGWHNNGDSPESKLLGGPVQEVKERAAQASPVNYVTRDAPPFLIMHGDRDNIVPFNQSELLARALEKAGVEVTLRVVKGAGHGGPDFDSPANMRLIEDFLDKHLRPAASKPKP